MDAKAALARALEVLDWIAVVRGTLHEGARSQQAQRLYEEAGDLAGVARVSGNLGVLRYFQGRWDEAIAYFEQAREAFDVQGDISSAARASVNIAEVLVNQGRLEGAERELRRARRVLRATGQAESLAVAETIRREGSTMIPPSTLR